MEESWQLANELRQYAAAFEAENTLENEEVVEVNSFSKLKETALELAIALERTTNSNEVRNIISLSIQGIEIGNWIVILALVGCVTAAKRVAQAIENELEREEALSALTKTLAHIERFSEALKITGLKGSSSLFLDNLVEWVITFEKLRPNLSIDILQETTRIFGWMFSDWYEIYVSLVSNDMEVNIDSREFTRIENCLQELIAIVSSNIPKNKPIESVKKIVRRQIAYYLEKQMSLFYLT